MGEYAAMTTMSALMVTLWLGGWHLPFVPVGSEWYHAVLSVAVFAAKVGALIFLYMWLRWTLPRFRYDQLMNLGWKVLLPIAFLNLALVAVIGVLSK
jgi:NADH-quinone oxidoreductase subunit H